MKTLEELYLTQLKAVNLALETVIDNTITYRDASDEQHVACLSRRKKLIGMSQDLQCLLIGLSK